MKVFITQMDAPPPIPNAIVAGIIASPGGQAGATPLRARINIVETIGAGTGVALSILQPARQEVFARGGSALILYPPLNTQIEANAVNAPVTMADGTHGTFTFDGEQTWLQSP